MTDNARCSFLHVNPGYIWNVHAYWPTDHVPDLTVSLLDHLFWHSSICPSLWNGNRRLFYRNVAGNCLHHFCVPTNINICQSSGDARRDPISETSLEMLFTLAWYDHIMVSCRSPVVSVETNVSSHNIICILLVVSVETDVSSHSKIHDNWYIFPVVDRYM